MQSWPGRWRRGFLPAASCSARLCPWVVVWVIYFSTSAIISHNVRMAYKAGKINFWSSSSSILDDQVTQKAITEVTHFRMFTSSSSVQKEQLSGRLILSSFWGGPGYWERERRRFRCCGAFTNNVWDERTLYPSSSSEQQVDPSTLQFFLHIMQQMCLFFAMYNLGTLKNSVTDLC